jgi:uncharacterized membrane protein
MPISILILVSFGLVLSTAILCLAPTLTLRSGIFFGVTVSPEFHRTPNARRIIRRYRRSVIVTALVCAAALWLVVPRSTGLAAPLTTSGLVCFGIMAGIVVWAIAGRSVRLFAAPSSLVGTATRTASLSPRPQTLPGGWLVFLGPVLIAVAMHFLLITRRDLLPPETYRAASALLLMGYVASALFLWTAFLVLFRTRHIHSSGLVSEQENSDKRFGYGLRLMFAYEFLGFMVAMLLPVAKIVPETATPWLVVISIFTMLLLGAIVLILVVKRRGGLAALSLGIGDGTPDACWKYGLIYYNPSDPAFVVGARTGPYGCDFNFANKWSWVVTFGLVAAPILIRLFWF